MHDLYERLRRAGTALATVRDEKGRLGWSLFQNPFRILTARAVGEVEPVFRELEAALRNGAFAAGFVAYEAAPAFDPELKTFPPDGFPLIRFALYREKPRRVRIPDDDGAPPRLSLEPEIEKRIYCERFADVKRNIEAGEIYQANLTFRCKGAAPQDPERLFLNLLARHPVPCAAFLHFEDMRILSLSPELFLESDGRRIVSRPMKGTAKRRPLLREDRAAARRLARDPKNRAENLMITDMVRNDLSKICPPGGVATKQLFHVETYRTVHQMVSEVRGGLRPGVGLFDVFRATFPPASITGAPKIRATQILFDDESSPRRVYTGAIGCFLPGGRGGNRRRRRNRPRLDRGIRMAGSASEIAMDDVRTGSVPTRGNDSLDARRRIRGPRGASAKNEGKPAPLRPPLPHDGTRVRTGANAACAFLRPRLQRTGSLRQNSAGSARKGGDSNGGAAREMGGKVLEDSDFQGSHRFRERACSSQDRSARLFRRTPE